MKKGVLGSWFREIATLIFTQTIQAFLLAIVMTIVISAMSASSTSNSSGNSGTNYAAGMLAIIALSQFGKIEMLVKNIFGVTSQFGDPAMQNGKGALTAGGLLAMRGIKKVGDNAGKIIGGTAGAIKGQAQLRTLNRQKDALNAQMAGADETLNGIENGGNLGTNLIAAQHLGETMSEMGPGGGSSNVGVTSSQIGQLIEAVNRQTQAVEKGQANAQKDKIADKMKELDKKIEETKASRNESLKKVGSGFAETAGAIVGGSAGAVYGLAQGDEIAKSTGIGIGIGDTAGSTAVNVVAKTGSGIAKGVRSVSNIAKGTTEYDKATNDVIKSIRNKDGSLNEKVYNKFVDNLSNDKYKKQIISNKEKARASGLKRAEKVKNSNIKGIDASNL